MASLGDPILPVVDRHICYPYLMKNYLRCMGEIFQEDEAWKCEIYSSVVKYFLIISYNSDSKGYLFIE